MNRAAQVISVFNLKGGVGKTTTVHMLSWALARSGVKVLVFDLDSQMSVSWAMMCRDVMESGVSWTEFMSDKQTIYHAIQKFGNDSYVAETVRILQAGSGSIHLCYGDPRLVKHESNVLQRIHQTLQVDDERTVIALPIIIEKTAEMLGAQVVLLDLNPSYSAINRLSLGISDYFIVPCFFDAFSANGIDQICELLIPDIFGTDGNSNTNQAALFNKINEHKNEKMNPMGFVDTWRFKPPHLKFLGLCLNRSASSSEHLHAAISKKRDIILHSLRAFFDELLPTQRAYQGDDLSDNALLKECVLFEMPDTRSAGVYAFELSLPAPFLTKSSVALLGDKNFKLGRKDFDCLVRAMEAAKLICLRIGLPYNPQACLMEIHAPSWNDEERRSFEKCISVDPQATFFEAGSASPYDFRDLPVSENESIEDAWERKKQARYRSDSEE